MQVQFICSLITPIFLLKDKGNIFSFAHSFVSRASFLSRSLT